MILDKEITIKISSQYFKYLLNLGYSNIKFGDVITIPIKHLKSGSKEKINVKCDICGQEKQLPYCTYLRNINCSGHNACSAKCVRKHILNNTDINISDYSQFSYLIGLLQTDGNLYETGQNKGKLTIEINIKDKDIIYKIAELIPVHYHIRERTRQTNYASEHSICLTVSNWAFRNLVKEWGLPAGRKSLLIKPPLHVPQLSIKDYIRGLIDGDGAVGFMKNGAPYVSLATQSDPIKEFITNYISEITGKIKKETNRNKRDNIYNIMIIRNDARIFCEEIYPKDCLSLNRKYKKAQEIKNWIRPSNMRICRQKRNWNVIEDDYIQNHTIEESMTHLNRTKRSVQMRLWRLTKQLF